MPTTSQAADWDTGEPQLKLSVRCTSSDCANDLHCFKLTRRMACEGAPRGTCRDCQQHLIELDRTRQRIVADRAYLLESLRRELIRHHFWHLSFDRRAMDHAARKGRRNLYAAAERRLRTSVGRATPFRDGTQTPMCENTIYYAQHATASCCRTCIEYWHGIPKGVALDDAEIAYLVNLVIGYLDERLPALAEDPVRVPSRRTTR